MRHQKYQAKSEIDDDPDAMDETEDGKQGKTEQAEHEEQEQDGGGSPNPRDAAALAERLSGVIIERLLNRPGSYTSCFLEILVASKGMSNAKNTFEKDFPQILVFEQIAR